MFRILVFFAATFLNSGLSPEAQNSNQPQTPVRPESSAPSQTAPAVTDKKPQVRYNYLNVCSPSDEEQQEIKAVLRRVPGAPKYNADFEISRGHTSLQDAEPARYLRLRRELASSAEFNTVQYSLSTDANDTHETLVVKVKDPKDLLMVSLEDKVSAKATAPAALLEADTPTSHIKLERFGKSSIVLARCEASDQSAFEPLFRQASEIFAAYRKSLGLRGMFRNDLLWLVNSGAKNADSSANPAHQSPSTSAKAKAKADQPKSGRPKSN